MEPRKIKAVTVFSVYSGFCHEVMDLDAVIFIFGSVRATSRPSPGKKKCKKAKWVSDKALQNLRKEEKVKEKRKTYPSECRVPKNSKKRLKKKKKLS